MKQKKKKLNIQKILFFILFIISAVYCINRYTVNTNINQSLLPNSINNSNYKIIKQDTNKNYSGIGQEKINNKDGYFTTFTTKEKNKRTYIEYNKNYTPEDLRQKYYPVLNYDNLSKELSSVYGIDNSDFYYDSTHLSNKNIINHLKTDHPIIICVWNKPTDNRWTTASHYMALLATDCKNMVYVSNPNGLENNSKSSGWYNINEITPYLAKALYIEEY